MMLIKVLVINVIFTLAKGLHIDRFIKQKYRSSIVMKIIKNYGPKMCALACTRHVGCSAINYRRDKFFCELLKISPTDIFKDMDDYSYTESSSWVIDPDLCYPNPCSVGKQCVITNNKLTVCMRIPTQLADKDVIVLLDMRKNQHQRGNIAYNMPSYQTPDDEMKAYRQPAMFAVDGNLTTYSHTAPNNQDIVNWYVDLKTPYHISRVEIFNRDSNGFRFQHVDVKVSYTLVSMDLCTHYEGPAKDGEHVILHCSEVMEGRYVMLNLTKYFDGGFLIHLAEVEVYGY